VKNLEISFDTFAGKVQAIRDVSFDLYKGETLAIVGESGSGKSVTTRSIMGLLASNANVDNGQILFNGTDILKKSEKELQKNPWQGNRHDFPRSNDFTRPNDADWQASGRVIDEAQQNQ
jgi:ABC-type dipeptide/oligopeptide/nickel transport system ATPase component